MIDYIIGFFVGIIVSVSLCYAVYIKKTVNLHQQLAELNFKQNVLEDLKTVFTNIANEALKYGHEDINKQGREALEEKIKPLTERILDFQNKIDKYNILEAENTTKIVEQINMLIKNNKSIESETKNLVEALTLNRNIKGEYGENVLESILQSCGMIENIHYSKQFVTYSVNNTDNHVHTVRPDFVINLPHGNKIIIDSKTTLTSYLNYVDNSSLYKEFKAEIKKRIAELSNKNYQNAHDIDSVDFVFMYIPIESCINIIYQDTDIVDFAYKSNVIIIGTASLITSLRLINFLIAQKSQNKNIKQIIDAGTNLYETFVQFCEDLLDVQKRFDSLSLQLNKTINRFKRGNQNKPSLFSQVEELKQFGVHTTKEIPEDLLNDMPDGEKGITING